MRESGGFSIEEIKEDVLEVCERMGLPLREIYVSEDLKEEVYQVEVELFKEYASLENLLREEIEIEKSLKHKYGDKLSVNIVPVEED